MLLLAYILGILTAFGMMAGGLFLVFKFGGFKVGQGLLSWLRSSRTDRWQR
jgi:hypothetical protein